MSPKCPQGLLSGTETVAKAVYEGDVAPHGLLTMHERRAFTAAVARTPIGRVDENSPLAQKVRRRVGKDGTTIEEIAMPDKLRAVELDAKLSGDLIERQEIKVAGSILQVTPENRAELLRMVQERRAQLRGLK